MSIGIIFFPDDATDVTAVLGDAQALERAIADGCGVFQAFTGGLIVPIGEWALRGACPEAASWSNPFHVAVKLSPVRFRRGDLPALVYSILLETGLAPTRLELEVTESIMCDDFSRATSIDRHLKSLGVKVALDDFGTGYASLSYLHASPFDKIKIDKSFVWMLQKTRNRPPSFVPW